ncbi:MAG: proline racemase family protein [Phycisphaerae bacterium]
MSSRPNAIEFVDTHTAGEPTRVLLDVPLDLGAGSVAERLARLRSGHDWLRRAVVTEPRGGDAWVGALLCRPSDASCAAGVIFFNNVGYLGMCGHGAMGVAAALVERGRAAPGSLRLETPVGVVAAELRPDGRVAIENVASFRHAADVAVPMPGGDRLRGDVAWGGNWFFLTAAPADIPLRRDAAAALTQRCREIRRALQAAGVRGANGAEIDHIELIGPAARPDADARNFVLCPGGAYDRSPCGTGTSAKVACLAADGRLAPGAAWRQESIVGSVFEARYRASAAGAVVTLTGEAYVTATGALRFDPRDPFAEGFPD